MIESSTLRFLSKNSLFSLIPEALDELAPFMELVYATPGKMIYQKGDLLDSLMIPIQEPLALISDDKVNLLLRGRALALTSLLRNTPLAYDVKSEDFNKIVQLPRTLLINYFDRNQEIFNYLMLMTESEPFRRIKHTLVERGIAQSELVKLAQAVSSPVPFVAGLENRSMVLLEAGTFSIDSKMFTATLKGGEFVGGFKAVNRPNPGYAIVGSGTVRTIDLEHLRTKNLDRTILDYFAGDPWVQGGRAKKTRPETITQIPEKWRRPWKVSAFENDPSLVKRCTSDWESLKETLAHFIQSYSIEVNRLILENKLERKEGNICLSLIAEILEYHGILTRPLKWKEDFELIRYPLIVTLGNRLVVVSALSGGDFQCFDNIYGHYKVSKDFLILESAEAALGVEIIEEIKTLPTHDPKKMRLETFRFILRIMRSERKTALNIAALTGLTYLLGALSPHFNELLLDEVLKTEDVSTLTMCLTGLFLVGAFTVLFDFIKNRLITKASISLDDTLTRYSYQRAQKLSQEDYARIGTGGVLNRLMEMQKIRHFFSTESLNILFSIGSAIIYGGLLAFYSPVIVMFVAGYFLILMVVLYFGRSKLYKINHISFDIESKTNSFIGDSIANILPIKAFSASEIVSRQWEAFNQSLSEHGKSEALLQNALDQFVEILGQIVKIGVTWYCMESMTKSGGVSFGQFFAIIQLLNQTISPMGKIVDFVTKFEDLKLSVDKVNDILHSKVKQETKARHSVNLTGKIKFDRVSFRYSADSPVVLKDVSFTIYPGQTVAIVGKSGSGKTTIANLIAKEVFPSAGRIYFDDVDSLFIDGDEVKSQIGYIQQNNQLFSGSIKTNVAFKDEHPEAALLEKAYDLSNSDVFLNSFPQRDDTYLAEGGMGLSGGQKQRLGMARTLYSNPKIMILDEATSALDSESEGVIIDKMLQNKGNLTTIVIAHRLSTIKNADYVYVVDNGLIVQDGTHNDLILRDGIYKELFQDQVS